MPEYQSHLLEKREIAEKTMAFVFERPEGFEYQAGQFIKVTLDVAYETDERGNRRSMSLASAPCEPHLILAMRMTGSGFKKSLAQYKEGETITFEGPFGHIQLPETVDHPLVFIAGGIGIVPFRSMLVQEKFLSFPHRIFLFYSTRTLLQAAFLAELEAIQHKRYGCIPTLSNIDQVPSGWKGERGRVTREMMEKYLRSQGIPAFVDNDDSFSPLYYVVGTPAMVIDMKQYLMNAGVKTEDIILEWFSGYK
jgi:NAD(P)H-flavin reductase